MSDGITPPEVREAFEALVAALAASEAVVAVQREALRAIELWPFDVGHTPERDLREIKERARAALDAEGVSELDVPCQEPERSGLVDGRGMVDTAPGAKL